MEMTDNSARLLGRMMGKLKATDEDGLAVLLTLGTEENAQEFFAWRRSLKSDPTPQECFEKAVEISGIMEEESEDED